jgi:hypothetical protein
MKSFSTSRPSPAIIVAVIALVFALVGSAVAGTDGLSSKITKSKVKSISKKQADKELKANISGSHVNTADTATTATKATDADTVGGRAGSAIVRVAANGDDDAALVGPSAAANVITTTITAPTAGFLVVDAGSDVFGTGDSVCAIRVDATDYAPSRREWEVDGAANSEEDCSTEGTIPVAAGVHTVALRDIIGIPAGVQYDEAVVQAIFIPFNGTGVAAAPSHVASGGQDSN